MKVKFADNTLKSCAAPTEQKIFKTVGGETTGVGWILILKLTGEITSNDLDRLLTVQNVETLEFLTEADGGEDVTLFTLTGYNKISSSIIRHAEDATSTYAEIQLSKGV